MSDDFKSPEPLPLTAEGEPLTAGSGLPPRAAAGWASGLLLPGGIVFYLLDRKDPYVRYYAIQSIVLSSLWLVVHLLVTFVTYIFDSIWLVGWVFAWVTKVAYAIFIMAWMVVWIITTFSAVRGKKWHLPYLSFVLRRVASRLP